MKKWLLLLTLLTSLASVSFGVGGSQGTPLQRPDDFNFILNYGVGAKNQIDTLAGTYTKDLVTDPCVTANLKLSSEEMSTVYKKMKDINILDYVDEFVEDTGSEVTPFQTYKLKVQIDGIEKNIYWEDKSNSDSIKAVQLRELFKQIHDIISQKEEYKKLPEPKGAYL